MIKKTFLVLIFFPFLLNAVDVSNFIDKSKCDQIIDKQLYSICYSYKYKGALSGWTRFRW
jgi:hypothetical protein